MTQNRILWDAILQRGLESVYVVEGFADIVAFAEEILVKVRSCRGDRSGARVYADIPR